MRSLIIFTLVGVGAQLVDGALGMAFGVTASTLLVLSGVGPRRPALRFTLPRSAPRSRRGYRTGGSRTSTGASSPSSACPGAVGAFLGATALSSLSTEDAAPVMAAILLAIGLYVLLRFSLRTPPAVQAGGTPATARNSWPRWGFSAGSSTHPAAAAGDPSPPARCCRAEDRAAHRHRFGQRVGVPGRGVGLARIPGGTA